MIDALLRGVFKNAIPVCSNCLRLSRTDSFQVETEQSALRRRLLSSNNTYASLYIAGKGHEQEQKLCRDLFFMDGD